MKNNYVNTFPFLNLYKKRQLNSKIDTQLLYGDNYKIIKSYKGWKKVRIKKDGYSGYIKNIKLHSYKKPNFKVTKLRANLFKNQIKIVDLIKHFHLNLELKSKKKLKALVNLENIMLILLM